MVDQYSVTYFRDEEKVSPGYTEYNSDPAVPLWAPRFLCPCARWFVLVVCGTWCGCHMDARSRPPNRCGQTCRTHNAACRCCHTSLLLLFHYVAPLQKLRDERECRHERSAVRLVLTAPVLKQTPQQLCTPRQLSCCAPVLRAQIDDAAGAQPRLKRSLMMSATPVH
eukprot:364429-Chlamydomonas_euryale.AAC.22